MNLIDEVETFCFYLYRVLTAEYCQRRGLVLRVTAGGAVRQVGDCGAKH